MGPAPKAPQIPKLEDIGRNIEQSFARPISNIGYAIGSGDYNNIGNSILDLNANMMTGGVFNIKTGETGIERKQRQTEEAMKAAEKSAQLASEEDRRRQFASLIESSSRQRQAAPGAAQTLLTSGYGNTLLTSRN